MVIWHRQLIAYHPVIGWWYIANLKAIVPHADRSWILRTNSIGMRSDREYAKRRLSRGHRIVLLGDSYAAGEGMVNSQRFSDLLEKAHPNLEVLNFALAGSGTDQQLLIFETMANSFEADAYVFAPFFNNILRNLTGLFRFGELGTSRGWYRPKPYFTLDGDELTLHNSPVPNEFLSEEEAGNRLSISERWSMSILPPDSRIIRNVLLTKIFDALARTYSCYESDTSQPWRLMRAIIERFVISANKRPVFIVPLPDYRHFLMGIPPTYLERYAKLHDPKKNCFIVDPLPFFNRLSSEARAKCKFEKDSHYSPQGHRVVAEAISDALLRYAPDLCS